jgi:outer membrane lipoprotein SlyB
MQTLTVQELNMEAGGRLVNAYLGAIGTAAIGGAMARGAFQGAKWGRLAGPWGIAAGAVIGAAVGAYLGYHQ